MEPPIVPTLDIHEIIGEKIRATAQRSRVRDLYDLYQFTSLPFDRSIVRRIAILKCWETGYSLDPIIFLSDLPKREYDWADLERLIKPSKSLTPSAIFERIQHGYQFLSEMELEESMLARDAYRRERKLYQNLLTSLQE